MTLTWTSGLHTCGHTHMHTYTAMYTQICHLDMPTIFKVRGDEIASWVWEEKLTLEKVFTAQERALTSSKKNLNEANKATEKHTKVKPGDLVPVTLLLGGRERLPGFCWLASLGSQ